MKRSIASVAVFVGITVLVAPLAAAECPSAVAAAVQKAHPGATIASCKKETEDGETLYDVTLGAGSGTGLSMDVTPDGTILFTEQMVAVSELPPAVVKAFAAKYGAAKPTEVEMVTAADGKVSYEIAFKAGATKKEATFGSDGAFIEEE